MNTSALQCHRGVCMCRARARRTLFHQEVVERERATSSHKKSHTISILQCCLHALRLYAVSVSRVKRVTLSFDSRLVSLHRAHAAFVRMSTYSMAAPRAKLPATYIVEKSSARRNNSNAALVSRQGPKLPNKQDQRMSKLQGRHAMGEHTSPLL